jgi:TonB family protein
MSPTRGWFYLALLFTGSALRAQQVTIGSVVAVPVLSYPSDTPPNVSSAKLPDYPRDWLKDGLPRWATVGLLVGEDGKVRTADVDIEDNGTIGSDLRRLATKQWRFNPGRLKGRAVTSACRVILLFNAAPGAGDSANRPVKILSAVTNPSLEAMRGITFAVYYDATILIGANGLPTVTQLTPHLPSHHPHAKMMEIYAKPEIAAAVTTMLGQWRFEPARKAGQPVDQSISLRAWAVNDAYLDTVMPVVIEKTQVHPEYPDSLRRSGNRGQVLIEFVVNAQGVPEQPRVVSSSHPDFERPAIAALLQWRFKPATTGGVPINTIMRVPIMFQLNGYGRVGIANPSGGADPYVLKSGAPQTKGPFPYDVPPQFRVITQPVYPFEALKQDKSGKASASWVVGADGKVIQVVITKASSPEFGQAYAAAIYNWEFEPARLKGKPTESILSKDIKFDLDERDFELDEKGQALLRQIRKSPGRIPTLRDLDQMPKARYQAPPRFPRDAKPGETLVEFYIDEQGVARFPRAVNSTNDDLIYPALSAVNRWQFDPPCKNGKPTVAVARISISYHPEEATAHANSRQQ